MFQRKGRIVGSRNRQPPGAARHVAVIGSGISGLSAAWLLGKTTKVTLYESEPRLGGHAHTVTVAAGDTQIPVDTGFIVYNERNYPNLTALFDTLRVETMASDMSFAASLRDGSLEYSGTGLNGLIGQRGNIVRPRFWRMLADIMRFYREAPPLLAINDQEGVTLGAYLDQNGYSDAFVEDHLLPMGAAIWSATLGDIRAYPLKAFVRFFASHGLLNLTDRPQWRTVRGGAREYVRRLTEDLPAEIRAGAKVVCVKREQEGVSITDASGETRSFTDVVIAAHACDALGMLADPDESERRLLGAFRYTMNEAVLHADERLMPRRKRVWSSWNYIDGDGTDGSRSLCVTYWMNRLQSLDPRHPLFVTLNPVRPVEERKVIRRFTYSHPVFDGKALAAQADLWSLQGRRRTWYCGAYFGYGFHEDGLEAGLAAAEHLAGVKRPWHVGNAASRIVRPQGLEAAE
ncbi:MAG: FAD-dependent oxidoreductase [Alphaproteobacteria bacterium]|nr:FAD-dependent oxidoreductase [Alphaproteobacteria bacterium]